MLRVVRERIGRLEDQVSDVRLIVSSDGSETAIEGDEEQTNEQMIDGRLELFSRRNWNLKFATFALIVS
jgi:hypothetical protein